MPSFEEQLEELERVVAQLERGDLSLEDSVGLFERGVTLSNACKAQLAAAESRVQVLVNPSPRGTIQTQDLAIATDDEEEAEADE